MQCNADDMVVTCLHGGLYIASTTTAAGFTAVAYSRSLCFEVQRFTFQDLLSRRLWTSAGTEAPPCSESDVCMS